MSGGWANHSPGDPWGDSNAGRLRETRGAPTGVPPGRSGDDAVWAGDVVCERCGTEPATTNGRLCNPCWVTRKMQAEEQPGVKSLRLRRWTNTYSRKLR